MRIVIFLSTLFICLGGSAQSLKLTTTNFTVQEGLVGDNVYCALQDSNGYLWFGTETGLSRYNGIEFKNFHMSDGIGDNEVLRIDEDSKGRIWFSAFNGKISYYYQGRFHNSTNDSTLAKINIKSHYTNFFEDSRGTVWLTTNGDVVGITTSGEVYLLKKVGNRGQYINIFIERGEEVWGFSAREKVEMKLWEHGHFVAKPERVPVEDTQKALHRYLLGKKTHLTQFDFKITSAYLVNLLHEDEPEVSRTSKIHQYSDQQIWICTYRGAVLLDRTTGLTRRFLEDYIVTHVLKDREDGFWLTTLGEGIFYAPSLDYKSIDKVEGRMLGAITAFEIEEEGIVFGGLGATFGGLKDDVVTLSETKEEGRLMTKSMVKGFRSGTYLQALESQLTERNQQQMLREAPLAAKTIRRWGNLFAIGERTSILLMTADQLNAVLNMDFFEARDARVLEGDSPYTEFVQSNTAYLIDMESTTDGLYIGTAEGLFFLSNDYEYSAIREHPLMAERINDIAVHNDRFVLSTHGFGVLLKMGTEWVQLSTKEGLASDIVRRVVVENDSTYWAATNGGVSRIRLNAEGFAVNNLTKYNGLNSEQVFDLIVEDGQLILGTGEGISIVNLNQWNKVEIAPLLNISGLSVDGELSTEERPVIDHKVKNIALSYDGIHFRSLNGTSYQYRLLGLSDNWISTEASTLNFGNLSAGEYTLEVQAISAFGVPSEIKRLSFTRLGPFWSSWWFIALAVLFSIILIIGLTSSFLKRKRIKSQKELEFKLRISEAERKALQSQLNPHFIFNSLNSIQRMVLKREPQNAYDYLERFSKLIRRILKLSESSTIALSEELETLALYIELENLRLKDKFEYKITVSDEVDLAQKVPSLMIQPYVENSIWHGLMPLEGKRPGTLAVSVFEKDTDLYIEILDNGVGRPNSWNEESMGSRIAQELVSKFAVDRLGTVQIEDLKNETEALGTKVTLHITNSELTYD